MAAPHVAGAWSLLREAVPDASVGTILNALRQTGQPITDTGLGGTATVPRVRHFRSAVDAGAGRKSAAGRDRDVADERARGNDVVDADPDRKRLRRLFGGSMERQRSADNRREHDDDSGVDDSRRPGAVGTAEVTVFTPAPGGGTSSSLTFTIDPAATLAVSASTVAPGGTVTVTLGNGIGGAQDWIAVAAVGTPNTSNLGWTYVGANVTTR